jgi:hypothetical protein
MATLTARAFIAASLPLRSEARDFAHGYIVSAVISVSIFLTSEEVVLLQTLRVRLIGKGSATLQPASAPRGGDTVPQLLIQSPLNPSLYGSCGSPAPRQNARKVRGRNYAVCSVTSSNASGWSSTIVLVLSPLKPRRARSTTRVRMSP